MMKRFEKPDFEVIVLENVDVICSSDDPCNDYSCPLYGDVCTGHNVHD